MATETYGESAGAPAALLSSERRQRALAEEERRRAVFLAEASAMLAEALPDPSGLFTRLARLAVPALGDWCLVRLSRNGTESTVGLAHVDPDKEPLLAPLDLGTLDIPSVDGGLRPPQCPPIDGGLRPPQCPPIDGGLRPPQCPPIDGGLRPPQCPPIDETARREVRVVEDDAALPSVPERFAACFPGLSGTRRALVIGAAHAAGMSSFVSLPLAARGRCLGSLILVVAGGRRFGPADVDLARALAEHAAVAVDNACLYRDARRAALAREDFLVFASHELRTPLTSLQLAAQALLRKARTDESSDHPPPWALPLLGAVERGALRLGSILDDLIDFSYLSSGVPVPVTQEVDLRAVVTETLDRWADVLVRADCTVTWTAEGPTDGCWDRRWLGQITGHLLSNAAKYGRGTPVEVILRGEADAVRLTVRDHGVGIPAVSHARIFERFERASAHRQAGGGLGLGLWLARRMVEGLGGTITVESAPGEGASFTVELPRASYGSEPAQSTLKPLTAPGLRGIRQAQPSSPMSLRAKR